MNLFTKANELVDLTRQLNAIHEQVYCLNQAREALAALENYTEGLAGHFSGPIAHLHIECGKNELSIRQQIVALGESVAATLQPPGRPPIVASTAVLVIRPKLYDV